MQERIRRTLEWLGLTDNEVSPQFISKWLIIALVLHFTSAIFSAGFYHFDEHWQILEFMNAHLGRTPFEVLPWEYTFKMRSWAQPGLYYIILQFFNLFGLEDPFIQAIILRLFSAFIGWCSLPILILAGFTLFKKRFERKWLIRLLSIGYFIPFLHARPSSEGMSASFFCIGVGLLILNSYLEKKGRSKDQINSLLVGFILGLAFLFRFQMGFNILFVWIWYVIWGSKNRIGQLWVALGVVLAVISEIPMDYWGYGEWTFTPWNYLDQNLVQDKASNFPTAPWYFFITKTISRAVAPISLIIVVAQLSLWIFRPKHPITWATFPLFLIHSLIAAKAFRYMFPIAPFVPFALMEMRSIINQYLPKFKIEKLTPLFKFCLGLNFILLLNLSFTPAKKAVDLYKFIYRHGDISHLYYHGENPYSAVGLPIYYYRPKEFTLENISSLNLSNLPDTKWVFVDKWEKIKTLKENPECQLRYNNYPLFSVKFNIGNWVERSRFWGLFYCSSK